MNIVLVNNEKQDFSGKAVEWEGHTITFTSLGLESVVSGGLDRQEPSLDINRNNLDRLVAETGKADTIFCESPEALLLWYVFSKRGMRKIPFVIEDEDVLRRVTALSAWIHSVYGDDVLGSFLSDPGIIWMHHNAEHREQYLAAGIAPGLLLHTQCSSCYISIVSPETYGRLRDFRPKTSDPDILAMKDTVVCPGANRRDFATFTGAMKGLRIGGWIISHRADLALETENVRWKSFVPLDDFVDALALARIVVVPMADETLSGGETSLTFSMALGKPVVATDTTASRELVIPGESGLLVPKGDAGAMKAAVMFLLDNPDRAALMGRNAKARECRIAALTRKSLLRAFDLARKSI